MSEGIWIMNSDGEEILIPYEDITPDQIPHLIPPLGGFCYEVSDFLALPIQETPYYIKGWLPKQGKMILYAPAKSGKSFLAIQAARCIGAGAPFLGMETTRARVLYIQCELSLILLRRRLLASQKQYDNVFVGTTYAIKLDTEHGQGMLISAMEAIHPDVVILDPLYKMIAGDENEAEDVLRVFNFLDSVIGIYECSFLVIDHSGKDSSRRARGSSVKEDWVDSEVEMRKLKETPSEFKVEFSPKLMRHIESNETAKFTATMRDFEFEVPIEENTDTVEARVYAMFQSAKRLSPARILGAGIGSNTSVYETLDKLIELKKIRKIKRGLYEIT